MSPDFWAQASQSDLTTKRLRTDTGLEGTAGIAELAVFHPVSYTGTISKPNTLLMELRPQVDTVAKRLMSNQTKIANASELNKVVFRESATAPASRKFVSLFPGLGYAAGYKVGSTRDWM